MTAFENILDRLERVSRRGNTATAVCPAHEDRTPSLSVRGKNRRAWVKCWAGCDDEDVLAAIGLEVRDLFDEPRGGVPYYVPRKPRPKPEDRSGWFPVVAVDLERGWSGVWLLTFKCPWCRRTHQHGGGTGPEPLLGHRLPHCPSDFLHPDFANGYVLASRSLVVVA